MYQRGTDGYPIGADDLLRETYGRIPEATEFQDHHGYGYVTAKTIHSWSWSNTFNRWYALVTFDDGWKGWTWPKPNWMK